MTDVTNLQDVELGVLGPLQVRQHGASVAIPGAKPRALLTMLGLHGGSVVSAETLVELLWGRQPPRTAAKALLTHISLLRRTLGDGFVLTEGGGWSLAGTEIDASRYKAAARRGRDATAAGDTGQALARFDEALGLWRGVPELPDTQRGASEKTRWIEGHAALVEDRADALLATGRAAEIIGELEAAVADASLRERRWGQLMLALYRAGRQGEALGAYQRARALLADELGVDPGPNLRRLEAAIVAQDVTLEVPVAQSLSTVTRAVTFLLTDIEGSTAAWEAEAAVMAIALARHDELVEQIVTSRGGRLIKTRGEGDATFSVFDRPSAAATAAMDLQQAIDEEPWALREPMRIRVSVHTGEVEFRDGDYFGRAVNRAARLRSLAAGGQILCSGATAELVIDSLPDDVVLADLGMRTLRNLARPEHVFELRLATADDGSAQESIDAPLQRPHLPAVLAGPGPFVGRGSEIERLFSAWRTALAGSTNAVLIAGEPGVGKTRLAGEWSRQAYDQGALVTYGRCDEDLGAPYQPFAEALRALVPCLGASGLRGVRGVEALLALVPGLADVLPDLAPQTRADPDTERYALFDAVVAVFRVASASAPVVLILDDLHWAAKPTLLLLRHLLRFGEQSRVQIVGTYRSTDLDRSHPLAAMLADLHRDGTADRLHLAGLDEDDVTAYVAEAGYDDEDLAHALASVTGGNPFFLIEALRHVDESGGVWDQSTLPQGVREAVSRRLSRLPAETNKALAAAAVVGSRFALDLVEQVTEKDLIDAFDEASKAGILIEEPGGNYRFNHAIVRQSLLAELASVRRMRLHQRIATTLETQPGAKDEMLAELAHHYFECAWAGNAVKAVEYCRRAADQAMTRLAYEGAADLYDRALHALEEIDEELPDRADQAAELLIARCEALLAAGDVASAAGAVPQLQAATVDSARLAAWATCFDGQLSMLIHPERLDDVEVALAAAAEQLAGLGDSAGEAKAHTVRAACLARLGRIGDCETALDDALTAARRARDHRRVNAVLAGAPLAALWGPNPVPRAGGRCLDVVRLLRITTDSPAVEATSTRCQAVLEAFRGRAAAARRMIDSARRTVTKLGLRHALLEVEQFAGIVELIVDDPSAAESHLRLAYNGFRRMGLDADTAETAAMLGRAYVALDRAAEADELCTESERLAGHALKPSIAWRTLRAQLLSCGNNHDEARRVAEAAASLAEHTDLLADHGDACLSLATVLDAAGDGAGARTAAERAVALYERKGAVALAEKAHRILGEVATAPVLAPAETSDALPHNACARALDRVIDALNQQDWSEVERLFPPHMNVESRRRLVRFTPDELTAGDWTQKLIGLSRENGGIRYQHSVLAVRGERVALMRLTVGTADTSPDAPQEQMLHVTTIDPIERFQDVVWFDIEDIDDAYAELDAAHTRLERTSPQRLENAASQATEHCLTHFAARDWTALAEHFAEDSFTDDRRPLLGLGQRHGKKTVVADWRAVADVGTKHVAATVIATRGQRLALSRLRFVGRDSRTEAFSTDGLGLIELNADGLIVACTSWDLDDFDAAIAELDARYLAGEAAAHAHAWSVIAGVYAAHNRRELAATTPDAVSIDHRRVAAFAPGEGIEYIRAGWELDQRISIYMETVHRLSDVGTVFTWAGDGTSSEGFAAEWRGVNLLTVDGELVNRSEVFDEADLDAALARFDMLSKPPSRLRNAASRLCTRFGTAFATRNWNTLAEMLAEDTLTDDRRRVVSAGRRHGRDAVVSDLLAIASLGGTNISSTVEAIRGERLVLNRSCFMGRDAQTEPPFVAEALVLVEINADNSMAAHIAFDSDDTNAAIAELEARFLAGEAAPHADVWRVIAGTYASIGRHELPAFAPDLVTVDHRRAGAFGPGELIAYIEAGFQLDQNVATQVEAVHRLNELGAVATYTAHGTSRDGFHAEWREVAISMVEGGMVNRCELFDETDLDAALARFDELSSPGTCLENAATKAAAQFLTHFAAGEWDAVVTNLAEGFTNDDRRRLVGAGMQNGRGAQLTNMHAIAELSGFVQSTVLATRGNRLALECLRFSDSEDGPDEFVTEVLGVLEIDTEQLISAVVFYEIDDLDAACSELESRYLAGEAAAHARTWSAISGVYHAFNQGAPPSIDWINVDHRRGTPFSSDELTAAVSTFSSLTPQARFHAEAIHRLNDFGAVVTNRSYGSSNEGLEVEWRMIQVVVVEGDRITRCELYDETDLDDALVRFDELHSQATRLNNSAAHAAEAFRSCFVNRDWAAMKDFLAEDVSTEDHRRVVNAEPQRGRDRVMQQLILGYTDVDDKPVANEIAVERPTLTVVATRGQRLVLSRARLAGRYQHADSFHTDLLHIVELDHDNRIARLFVFDVDDVDAAFARLDARYLVGEAAAHARTWSVISRAYAALNRRKVPAMTPDCEENDHRSLAVIGPGHLKSYIRATWDLGMDTSIYVEAVHRLTDLGAVVNHVGKGTSQDGFDAEWRTTDLFTVEGDLINRCEMFDDTDLNTALARFDELDPPPSRPQNAAARVNDCFAAYFTACDWNSMAEILTDDMMMDDRRRVVGAGIRRGRDAAIADLRATADLGRTSVTSVVLATRGEHLLLARARYFGRDQQSTTFYSEVLGVLEIDAAARMVALVTFDHADLDAALEELDERYLSGEAAAHAPTWSTIAQAYATLNRREIPATTADFFDIDHRSLEVVGSGELKAYLGAALSETPDNTVYVEAVHRLTDLGAVVTHVSVGTSREGFEAEWRITDIFTVEGNFLSRCEMFDDTDVDAALARFDELMVPECPADPD